MDTDVKTEGRAAPWNKGKLLGQKPPLKLKEIWAIRVRLQLAGQARELALFNLAIDSKLRGCDLVGLRVHDVVHGSRVACRSRRIFRLDSIPGLSGRGLSVLVWTARPTARIRCDARKLR